MRGTSNSPSPERIDPTVLRELFDRPEVVAAYVFGSVANATPHALSDVDLAYVGTDAEAEDRVFDPLFEALQQRLGDGNFDLVPVRRAPLHLQFEIATRGHRLLVRDPVAAERFEVHAITRYLDFKHYRDEYFARSS
jgi:predicted nucleotidyltransferase